MGERGNVPVRFHRKKQQSKKQAYTQLDISKSSMNGFITSSSSEHDPFLSNVQIQL